MRSLSTVSRVLAWVAVTVTACLMGLGSAPAWASALPGHNESHSQDWPGPPPPVSGHACHIGRGEVLIAPGRGAWCRGGHFDHRRVDPRIDRWEADRRARPYWDY